MNPNTPLPFQLVQDLHQELGGGQSLVDFATRANRVTNSGMFDSAVGNPFAIGLKQASAGLDRFIDENAGPVDETLGDFGSWVFRKVGADEEFGRQVGEGLLRDFVDYVPAIAGYALAPVTGGASVPVGLAGTALMSGANAYEKSGSPLMGLTSGALAAFGGKLTEFGATTALRGAAKVPILKKLGIEGGERIVTQAGDDIIEQLVAKKVGDRVLGAVAGESFVNVAGMLNEAGVGLVETGEWQNPFTKENFLAEMLDPTFLFGVKELVQPSVISTNVIRNNDELKQFTNADTEEAAQRMAGTVPDLRGQSAAEVETLYRDWKWKANAIEDETQRKATLALLQEAHTQARAAVKEGPVDVPTLFGEALQTKLELEQSTPPTIKEVQPDGQVVETPLTLDKVLNPEELKIYNEQLSDLLSPASMLRLTELSEIDTPKTQEEYQSSVVKMNAIRAELERGSVDDAWFRERIDTFEREGETIEVAAEKAWQVAKNETEAAAEAVKKYPLTLQRSGREREALARGVVRPSQTESDPDIVKAQEAVEDMDDEGWTPTDWSKLEPVREVPGSAGGVMAKLKARETSLKKPRKKRENPLLSVKDEEVRPRKRSLLDEFNDEFERDIAKLDLAGEEELGYWPANVKPLVPELPEGDESLSLALSDVVGVDEFTGNLVIGNKSQQLSRKADTVSEVVLQKWLSRFGLGSRTWNAYKLAWPELVKNGKVNVEVLKQAAKEPLVRVDVHGRDAEDKLNDLRQEFLAQLQHDIETRHGSQAWVDLQTAYLEERTFEEFEEGSSHAVTEEEFEEVMQYFETAYNPDNDYAPQDFAEQYGSVAPDNFEPFDPTTGLGNVAYELRVRGVTGGGQHTGNDDTLAWVRGKFVEQYDAELANAFNVEYAKYVSRPVVEQKPEHAIDDAKFILTAPRATASLKQAAQNFINATKKVFRIDEVQSDAAQEWHKYQASRVENLEADLFRISRRIEALRQAKVVPVDDMFEIQSPLREVSPVFRTVEQAEAKLQDMLRVNEEALRLKEDRLSEAKSNGHPLFDSFETLALRTAIQRARENGADEIFLPDGETAMMSEGHDRAAGAPLFRPQDVGKWTIKDRELGTFVYSRGNNAFSKEEMVEALKTYNEYGERGVLHQITDADLEVKVSQSKGMTDAYDRRLPQTAAKLLGEKGTPVTLGTHKNGPSPVFKDKPKSYTVTYPSARGPITETYLNKAEAESRMVDLQEVISREKLQFQIDGGGKSSVTGLSFSVKRSQFPGDPQRAFEAERVATRDELFNRIMRKQGTMSNAAIERSRKTFNKLFDLFDGDDVQLFEILDSSIRGAATLKGATRKLFLGDKGLEGLDDATRGHAVSFVTAHELAHNSEQLYNEGLLSQRHWDMFDKFQKWSNDATPADRKLALEIMRDAWVQKKHRNSEVVQTAMSTLDDPKEFRANVMSMWAMGQVNKPDGFALNLLPTPLRKGLQVLSDLYHAVVSSMRGISSFDFMFNKRQEARAQLDSMAKMMRTWKKELNKSEEFYTEAAGLARVGPQSYRDTLAFFGKKEELDRTSVLPHDDRGFLTRVFDEWIMPFDQLTQMVPQFKGIAADLHNYTGDTRAALNRIAGMIAGELTPSGKVVFSNSTLNTQWKMVRNEPALDKAASDWMRVQQTAANPAGGTGRVLSYEDLKTVSPELRERLDKLPEKKRTAVINIVTRMGKAMQRLQTEALNVLNASNEAMVTSYIANKNVDLRKDAPGLSQLLFRGLKDIRSADPATARGGQIMLSQVATKLEPEMFQRVYDIAHKAADSYDNIQAQFLTSPHFFSEMRFGKYFLHWTDKEGNTGGIAYDSLQDARAKERQLKAQGINPTWEETSRGAARIVGRDQLLARLEEFDDRGKALVDELDLDDETKRILKNEFNTRWEFLRDVNAAKIIEPGSKRGFAQGREDLDMIQTQMLYFQVAIRSLNKKLLNHRLNYRFSDPALKDPKVMAYRPQLDQMIKNFFTPDTEVGRGIATFGAGYFLGGNLSSHLIELMQPGFSFISELVIRNVGYVEANRMTLKAMMDVGMFTLKHLPSAFGRMVKRKLPSGQLPQGILEGRDDNSLWDQPEYGPLMDYAATRGAISLGHASDTMQVDVENNVDINGMLKTKGRESALKRFGATPVMNLVRFPLKFYQQFTEFNARVSLILGYELAKKNGATKQRAMEEALEFSRTVTFSGGKLNRPNQMFSGEGTYRTVGQGLYSLQGYTFGMLGMMRRYAELGFSSKQFPEMNSVQRKAARKSLGVMLTTQFLGAGALGMPFVQAAMLLAEKFTGIEFEREMREGLAQLFQEDEEEDEGLLSDAVMHGAANAILGSMLPGDPDLGSRFSIGGVMGINSYEGYSLPQLFGPTTSVIQNVLNGVKSATAGDYALAFQDMAPVAMKKLIETVRNEGELRNRNGELLVDATYGEKLAYAVGFTPQRVKRMRNRERLQARHEEKTRQDMIRRMDQLADLFVENPAAAMNELHRVALEDPQVEIARQLNDPRRVEAELVASKRRAAQKIADRLEKKIFPRDPGAAGTLRGTQDSAVIGAEPSEQARLQLRAQVESGLGLQPSLNQRAVKRAALIDTIRQRNPTYSRAVAAEMADQLLASHR